MEFQNLTPFEALAFSAIDVQDREHHIVAMAVGYRLVRGADGAWQAQLIEDEPVPLCLADEHWGDPVTTSLRRESDLVPYKPRCDVLVRGQAYAPEGLPAKTWRARIKLSVTRAPAPAEPVAPQPLNPFMGLTPAQQRDWEKQKAQYRHALAASARHAPRVVLDKKLALFGPSEYVRRPLLGWRHTAIQPATAVPLRWESSFGGRAFAAKRVHVRHRAHGADGAHEGQKGEQGYEERILMNEVCFSNPCGSGWMHKGWEAALSKAKQDCPARMPAPQIMAFGTRPPKQPLEFKHPHGEQDARAMRRIAADYGIVPAGFGPLCKAWAPRLALAGTYDEVWLRERHPYLPKDFDFAYWNGAPQDQQIDFPDLTQGYVLQTEGLVPGGEPMTVALPPHRSVALADLGGLRLPFILRVDTVILDTDTLTLTLVWRTSLLRMLEPETLELRFILDPHAPWIPYKNLDTALDESANATAPAAQASQGALS